MRALNRVFRAKTINTQRRGVAFSIRQLFANSEPGVWYDPSDLSTLFQDTAGTTPVTAVEQPVGLMLDKSKGPVLVTNGTFNTDTTGWSIVAGAGSLSVVDGKLRINSSGTVQVVARQNITTVVGKWYRFSANVFGTTTCGGQANTNYIDSGTKTTTSTVSYLFLATGTSLRVDLIAVADQIGEFTDFDNISVRELPGNHAYQTTATSRPVLSARYNLLTKTEQFDDAVWTKANVALTVNGAAAPDGTTTADLVYPSSTGSATAIYQGFALPAGSYSVSFAFKAAGKRWVAVDGTNTTAAAYFDLQDGVVGTVAAGHAAFISSLGSGWYRCTVTNTTSGGYGYFAARPVDADGTTSVTANGTSGIYIWGASLVPSNQADLPYQRVNTATDYDTAGFPHYLRFDGVDDWLVTNTITPGIDKVQVFAGVRRLQSVVVEIIVETGNSSAFPGAFYLVAEITSNRYGYAGRGNRAAITNDQVNLNFFPPPDTAVLTVTQDINGNTPSRMRRNAGEWSNSINTTFGGGNFLAYPLYIGRRGGTTYPFNGHLYSLIVRFGSNLPTATIEKTEKYINGLTKAY